MKFSYTVAGQQGQNDGSDSVTIIDTESAPWKDRIRFIKEKLGLSIEPEVAVVFDINPGADGLEPVGVHKGTVKFTYGAVTTETVAAEAVWRNPEYVVDWLNRKFGIGLANLDTLRYTPPAPPAIVEDWKTPGAPLGEPWEMNGATRWRALIQREGLEWTGPSGAVYIVRRQPGLFAYYAFEKK